MGAGVLHGPPQLRVQGSLPAHPHQPRRLLVAPGAGTQVSGVFLGRTRVAPLRGRLRPRDGALPRAEAEHQLRPNVEHRVKLLYDLWMALTAHVTVFRTPTCRCSYGQT